MAVTSKPNAIEKLQPRIRLQKSLNKNLNASQK